MRVLRSHKHTFILGQTGLWCIDTITDETNYRHSRSSSFFFFHLSLSVWATRCIWLFCPHFTFFASAICLSTQMKTWPRRNSENLLGSCELLIWKNWNGTTFTHNFESIYVNFTTCSVLTTFSRFNNWFSSEQPRGSNDYKCAIARTRTETQLVYWHHFMRTIIAFVQYKRPDEHFAHHNGILLRHSVDYCGNYCARWEREKEREKYIETTRERVRNAHNDCRIDRARQTK